MGKYIRFDDPVRYPHGVEIETSWEYRGE